jgi:hypothetical protein
MAAEPGGDRLIPDELDILVPREAKRHDEGPSTADDPGRVGEHRAGAKINLSGLPRGKVEADSGFGRRFPLERRQQATHRRVTAGVAVFAFQGGENDDAGNALGMPGGNLVTPTFQAGNGGTGSLRRGQGGGDDGIVGQDAGALQPALGLGQAPQAGRIGPAHETALGNVAVGIALTHAHQSLSVVVHLDSPSAHRSSRQKIAEGTRGRVKFPRCPLATSPSWWLEYADHRLAHIRRSRGGSYTAITDWPNTPIIDWLIYAGR